MTTNVAADEALRLEGLLVASPPGRARIVMEPYCLEFAADDVRAVIPQAPPPGLDESRARAVTLELAPAARLLSMAPAAAILQEIWRYSETFAVATRARVEVTLPEAFLEQERAFYARVGL